MPLGDPDAWTLPVTRPTVAQVPCASVLKPVYAWLAPHRRGWTSLAEAAITRSDDDATDKLVQWIGGTGALAQHLSRLAGTRVAPAATWGRFMVSAATVKSIYESVIAPDSPSAEVILDMMKRVVPAQRFGVPPDIAVKAGWDLRTVRNRPVLVTNLVWVDGYVVHAHVGGTYATTAVAERWQAALDRQGPEGVLPFHRRAAKHLPTFPGAVALKAS